MKLSDSSHERKIMKATLTLILIAAVLMTVPWAANAAKDPTYVLPFAEQVGTPTPGADTAISRAAHARAAGSGTGPDAKPWKISPACGRSPPSQSASARAKGSQYSGAASPAGALGHFAMARRPAR